MVVAANGRSRNWRIGVEKARPTYSRGDVGFLPSGGLVCVFLGTATTDRPINPVGKVEAGMEAFDSLRPGDSVRIFLSVKVP